MPKTSDNNGTNGGLTNEGRSVVQNFSFLLLAQSFQISQVSLSADCILTGGSEATRYEPSTAPARLSVFRVPFLACLR